MEALRREGFPVVKADNDVSDGIRVTADLLRQGRLKISQDVWGLPAGDGAVLLG